MAGFFAELQYLIAVVAQLFPPKSKFTTDQIPDLSGKVAIVTGKQVNISALNRELMNESWESRRWKCRNRL